MTTTVFPDRDTADRIRQRPAGRDVGWWGMAIFIATEASLFACLILSYFYLRFYSTPAWPPAGIESPTLRLPVVMTIVLVGSSLPMQLAAVSARRGQGGRMLAYQLVAMVMAAAFIAMQCIEYHDKLQQFTARTNSYGSLFYLITGTHGTHVVIALLMSAWMLLSTRGGRLAASRSRSFDSMVLYWHFVDVVWIVIFSSLYLGAAL
jgi:heme/copper-type cytochrome/quinol oxidase subunit 3